MRAALAAGMEREEQRQREKRRERWRGGYGWVAKLTAVRWKRETAVGEM